MITVRRANGSDATKVLELVKALAEHHGQADRVLTTAEEFVHSGFGDEPKFHVLLAEYDGSAVGFLSYTVNYSIWLGMQYMNIDDVFVDDDHRGKGVGEALMQNAKEVCISLGGSRIRWEVDKNNEGAIRFYRRLGAAYAAKGIFRWDVA